MPTEGYGSYYFLGVVITFLVLILFRTITANGEKIEKEEFGAFGFIAVLWPYYLIKIIEKWVSQLNIYVRKKLQKGE